GGTGAAPVKSLIRLMSADPATASRLHVLLGFRSPADLLFREELASWASLTNLHVTVDRGDASWTGHTGVITTMIPSLPLFEPEATRVVVVGPP
ncbi:MAG TPA: anaerobic sulfite reductase subunit AsrB, partial [Candidatus Ozemobacteraceae bacterium]|nr:anaerobic sulfite reductase subunit AsrB [Candidatus Ozemobacteraceae bacterium]